MLCSTNTRVHNFIFFYFTNFIKCTDFPFWILICKGVKFTLFHWMANCSEDIMIFYFSLTHIHNNKIIYLKHHKIPVETSNLDLFINYNMYMIIIYIRHPFKMCDDVVVNQIFDRISALLTLWILGYFVYLDVKSTISSIVRC